MSKNVSDRVPLKFSNLDEVTQRLNLLLSAGYTSLGKWNLAQVCEHLRDWMVYPMDGYPKAPFPINLMLWGMKVTIGKSIFRKILESGQMQVGGPTMGQTVHSAEGIDDASSVRRLKEMISRLHAHRGAFHASPLFGPLSAETGMKLQLVHCAHHLSFLVPKASEHAAMG